MELNKIYNEDCLIGMKEIPDKSIDMIFCDLPYGTTQCKWDAIIPFNLLWQQYERIIKDNGAIVLTCNQPFTSALLMSNPKLFKYEMIWEKSKPTGFLDAKIKPLRCHESILIFYKKQPIYNPQTWEIDPIFMDRRKTFNAAVNTNTTYGNHTKGPKKKDTGIRLPISVIPAKSVWGKDMHPTQKPVPLVRYFIRTFTNEGDITLDNCMGRGTTAIACIDENRQYIGFEKDKKEYNKCIFRVECHLKLLSQCQ